MVGLPEYKTMNYINHLSKEPLIKTCSITKHDFLGWHLTDTVSCFPIDNEFAWEGLVESVIRGNNLRMNELVSLIPYHIY